MANKTAASNPTKTSHSNGQNGTAKTVATKARGQHQKDGSAFNATNGASAQSKKAQKAVQDAHVAKANEYMLQAWKLLSQCKESDG